jgi:hypothetical protein
MESGAEIAKCKCANDRTINLQILVNTNLQAEIVSNFEGLLIVKWEFSYKKIKIKDIFICESYHKLNPNIQWWISKAYIVSPSPHTLCEFECGVAFDQWVPNISEVPSRVLIIDFVRWLCAVCGLRSVIGALTLYISD